MFTLFCFGFFLFAFVFLAVKKLIARKNKTIIFIKLFYIYFFHYVSFKITLCARTHFSYDSITYVQLRSFHM